MILLVLLAVLAAMRPHELASIISEENTLSILLFFASLLIATRALEYSGMLSRAASWILSLSIGAEYRIILLACLTAAASTILMNDAALFVFVPVASMMARFTNMDNAQVIVPVIIAANIGSSLTPIGNPQNLYVWRSFNIPALRFVEELAPFVALSMLALVIRVLLSSRNEVSEPVKMPVVRVNTPWAIASLILLALIIVGGDEGYAIQVFIIALAFYLASLRRHRIGINYGLLLLFVLMVIDFKTISGMLASIASRSMARGGFTVFLAGLGISQAISNVPATIMLSKLTRAWRPLIVGVNLGGIGVLLGSLANIIGVRLGGIDASSYHRYALPLFAALSMVFAALSMMHVYP